MEKDKEEYILSAETIDRLSQLIAGVLAEAEADKRDTLRIRLSLEEILGVWLEKLGNTAVLCRTGQKFGRTYIEVCVEGRQLGISEDSQAFLLSNRLLAQTGLALIYSYKGGRNCLICNPPKKSRIGQMTQLIIAILGALCLGGLMRFLPDSAGIIATSITEPIFNTILGILRAISSPMIFLAVCWGIVSIGDLATVEKIGKQLIVRMVIKVFAVCSMFALVSSLFFEVISGKNEVLLDGFSEIYIMVLDIVPSDIVSPFLEGNALQIIFLGICIGAALLVLGQRVSAVQDIVVQANEVVQFLMGIIGKLVPIFVFLSIFNLMLFDAGVDLLGIMKVFALAIPGCLCLILLYLIAVAARFRVSPVLLIKKLLPTYLIAVSTGSSAAAFATNLETCVERLGIPGKVANFAIPLGQVIYKPGASVGFFSIAVCMAEYYNVDITVIWLVTASLTVGLLSMAAPPIPGGALSVFTVMFAQLGVPGEAIALAVAVNSILDFIMTSTGLTCLQAEVTLTAGHMNMLNKEKLARE